MTGRVVTLTSDNVVNIREIMYSFDELCKLIGSDGLEVVKTLRLVDYFSDAFDCSGRMICMLVDDLGAVKGLPVNDFASYMYGALDCFIHGDVIFLEIDQYGQDYPLDSPEYVLALIERYFI